MKRVLLLSLVLSLSLAAFSACGKAEEPGPTDGPGAVAPFNVPQWLEVEANAMAFQYIDVSVYQDVRDAQPIGHMEATETEKEEILGFLEKVYFIPDAGLPPDFTADFAFAMNEPFVFFGFTDAGLLVKVPSDEGTGYLYYGAEFKGYPQLLGLREYIGEMRLGYSLEPPEPGQ